MPTIFEIIKLTPKTNCGRCGYPTCMAFAAGVVGGAAKASLCPDLDLGALGLDEGGAPQPREGGEPETQLLRELQSKMRGLDLAARAAGLGAEVLEDGQDAVLGLRYLGRRIRLSSGEVAVMPEGELDPRDQILLYNYVYFGGSGPASGEWVGLESFPNSISKVVSLRRYAEEKLATHFAGRACAFGRACGALGGGAITPCHATACFQFAVLPRLPLQVHFWDDDPEDGFPAKVKVLFDRRAMDFLDLESLVFVAERLAETLIQKGPA